MKALRDASRQVDLIITAEKIHCVDATSTVAEAVAVKDGRIAATGRADEILDAFQPEERLDFGEATVYPGFMDPHCHFLSYGLVLSQAQLFGATSWEDVVARLAAHRHRTGPGWVQGRGWDQNLWGERGFPTNELLDRALPRDPVLARRIDGHAAIANSAALDAAGIDASTKVEGGSIILRDGRPTGLLLDNAIDLLKKAIPAPDEAALRHALLSAQERCFGAGLCSVSNAGTEYREARLMETMHDEGVLTIGDYLMLIPSAENIEGYASRGAVSRGRISIRSFKMFADGALGSRGARLLEPYADDPGNSGLFTLNEGELDRVCSIAAACGFQMNVHAIGDAAARRVLDVYARHLSPGNDRRWRIEHAQLIHDEDLPRFARLGVVPSVQTTHAASDMKWTESRLGRERLSRSHRYRDLLEACGWLANGSDFPIEKIDPLRGFRAAVFRTDDEGRPEGGYRMSQSLSREAALRAMTIWAARANFEEHERGSIETGKAADFTVLDRDLLAVDEAGLRSTRVAATVVAGQLVHSGK
jgi:predicted amidohydrolase YtcJ